jgi:hypothetical protein
VLRTTALWCRTGELQPAEGILPSQLPRAAAISRFHVASTA